VLGSDMFERMKEAAGRSRLRVQSPIEAVFYAWWAMYSVAESIKSIEEFNGPSLVLDSQHEITVTGQRYVLDFRVHPRSTQDWIFNSLDQFPRLAIELDGHDFHERTKEQVIWRDSRDRLLQQHGWQVFHVSGSELWRDPEHVVYNIHAHCLELFYQFAIKHKP